MNKAQYKKRYGDKAWFKDQRYREREKYYSRGSRHNARARWTEEERDLLKDHNYSDLELSVLLGRSIRAIQLQRMRMRKRGIKIAYKSTKAKGKE